MIINIKHKGLRKFAETGNNAGIPQQFTQRLKHSDELAGYDGFKGIALPSIEGRPSRRVFVRGQWKLARSV